MALCHPFLMLRLYYVPCSHSSPKRSSPWGFGHFCLHIQVLLRLVTFSRGLSRYPWQTLGAESGRLDDALRLGPRSSTVDCMFLPGLPRSVGTSHVLSRFDHVLPRLSSSVKVSYAETGTTGGVLACLFQWYKKEVSKLLQALYS